VGEHRDKPVIGLLGGVGSGKSTVASELAALGCAVIDADAVGHEVLAEPPVKTELRRLWGEGVFGPAGEADREAVGRIVFESADALAALNALVHPRMRERMARRIAELGADEGCPAVVLDAALLLETDWHELCTTLVFVSAPAAARAERVARERHWDSAELERRENSQKPLDIKRSRADHILDNSSSLSYLREQVRSIFHRIVDTTNCP